MSDNPASTDGFRWEIRRSLIERLRIPWDGMGDMGNQQRADAAIAISTMMDEIEAWRRYSQKAERDIADLIRERDEARREVCTLKYWNFNGSIDPSGYAALRKWDCFRAQA